MHILLLLQSTTRHMRNEQVKWISLSLNATKLKLFSSRLFLSALPLLQGKPQVHTLTPQ